MAGCSPPSHISALAIITLPADSTAAGERLTASEGGRARSQEQGRRGEEGWKGRADGGALAKGGGKLTGRME